MAVINTWRKDLFTKIKKQLAFLRDRRVEFPEILTLTTGAKGNLFELGGQDHSSGIAVIIAAPSGKPAFSRILHKRWPNELHSAVGIWPGCLVALGSHHMGSENMVIYSVTEVQQQGPISFGTATLKRLAYKTPFTHSGISPDNWYETEKLSIDVMDLVAALKKKLYTYNCEDPIFIEWFHEIKKVDKNILFQNTYEKGVNGKLKIGDLGIDESNIQYTGVCTDFEAYMKEIRNVADDLNENFQSKFVYVQFAYFLDENENLVCQARHFHNVDGPYFPFTPHNTLYTITLDTQEKIDGTLSFMNKYNPAYRRVIFGTSGLGALFNYLTAHKENTVSNFAKYAKCTSRPTFLEPVEKVESAPVKPAAPSAKKKKGESVPVPPIEEVEVVVPETKPVVAVKLEKSTDPNGTFLIDDNLIKVNKKFKLAKPIILGQLDDTPYTAIVDEVIVENGHGPQIVNSFGCQLIEIAVDVATGERVQTNTIDAQTDTHKFRLFVRFEEKNNTISSNYMIHRSDDNVETDDQSDEATVLGYKLSAYYAE